MSELYARIYVLVAQSCLSLCDRMDCSPPGSTAHGILQAFPSPGDLPDGGTKPSSPESQADFFFLSSELQGSPRIQDLY